MNALRIAGLQFDIAWEDPEENFRRVDALATEAAASGARLIVLPEMFATGFSMAAERVTPHAPRTREYLAALARRLQVWVLAGYGEPGGEATLQPRNACALFDPQGTEALRYHKLHPFSLAGEPEHYAAGESLATATVEGVRITPLICYDLRFPEPFRIAAEATDLFVVIANWPDPRIHAWSTLLQARAIENQAYVLGVNRRGEAQGLPHSGRSALIDPMGEVLATLAHQDGVVAGTVTADRVDSVRQRFGFLADRRPETYRVIQHSR